MPFNAETIQVDTPKLHLHFMDFVFLCNDNVIELLHMNQNVLVNTPRKEYNLKKFHNPSHN